MAFRLLYLIMIRVFEHGLTGSLMRALLNASHPVVIIGTLWQDGTPPTPPACADPHAREREVLKLADVVCITPAFSEAEQDRARAAAARDPRPGRTVLYRGSGPRLWYGSGTVCGSHRGG